MALTYCYRNQWLVLLLVVGVFLASAFLFLSLAQAAEETQIEAAIEDLSSATGQNITSKDQAKDLCNQEQYLDVCAGIGKKHELYEPEELKQVDNFLSEVKGKILDDIKNCVDEECLVRVASELAIKIKTKNPTLATDLNLTTTVVAEKQAVVQAAKEVGVNFRDCETMDPDTASVDLLRKCARLAKDIRVQKYIPEEKRVLANQFGDTTIQLRESLSSGKYQCGDGTLEGCGNYCLNPDSATRAAGIPTVCTQIAKEVFGQEGVKQLETSYQQVGQIKDYYSDKFILVLPNGKKLVGENQIKNACSEAFSGQLNNIEMAKACGNFAVKNGFASQSEVEKGIKLLVSISQKDQKVDFNKCIADPAACRDFIPEDDRNRFDAGNQIFALMKSEIGFDPSQCERGAIDETIGTKCFEGSKRALAKIESLGLATQSEEAKFIVEDIKRHVAQGEEFMNKKDEFKQVFSQQGGPGGCRSEAECFTYCSNPTNGPECISFGAKQQISGFKGEEAVQKFQEYNQNLQRPGLTSNEYTGQYQQFPGQGPYPGFQPPGQGGYIPPGQVPGFTQPGPGFGPPSGVGGYYPGPGPVGPSPECFAAIQSGDFSKAKTVCSLPALSIPLPTTPTQICPATLYIECPAGQNRESFRDNNGCWVDGPCRPAPTFSPGPYPTFEYKGDANSCPGFAHSKRDKDGKRYCRLNETNSCQYGYPAYLDRANYVPSDCPTEYGGPYPTYSSYPTVTFQSCPSGQWWDGATNRCTSSSSCGYNSYWDPASQSCKPSGGTYSPYPTYTPSTQCNYNNFCDQGEDGAYCRDCAGTPYPNPSGSCPSGYHYHGESGGFCMNDQENYSGTCYNAVGTNKITCPQSTYTSPSSCPSGQWWDMAKNSCVSSTTSYTPMPSCPSGQWWDYSRSSCVSSSTTYTPYPSCPSGQWWDYATGSCKSSSSTGYCGNYVCDSGETSTNCISDCGSGTTYTPPPTYSYSPPPSSYTPPPYSPPPSCSAGYYWDSAVNSCLINPTPPPSTTTYTPYPTTEYTPPPYSPPPAESSPPPPTSGLYPHYIVTHCQQLGRTWDGSKCQANGLFARLYEKTLANILRSFYMIP